MKDETLGARLRRLRSEKGISGPALAKSAGILTRQLYRFESGERDLMTASLKTALAIACALGLTVEELVGK